MLLKEKQDSEELNTWQVVTIKCDNTCLEPSLTNIYITQLCGQHGSILISLTPQGRGKGHALVNKPDFEKDGGG